MIIIKILQILVFASWIAFILYSYFRWRKKLVEVAEKNNLTVAFECKKCQTIHRYPYSEFLKIIRKVRNEKTIRSGTRIYRQREYKYECSQCQSKQWQKQIDINPFFQEKSKAGFSSITYKFVGSIFGYSILVVVLMALLSNFID